MAIIKVADTKKPSMCGDKPEALVFDPACNLENRPVREGFEGVFLLSLPDALILYYEYISTRFYI
jgi:hypothetical protein